MNLLAAFLENAERRGAQTAIIDAQGQRTSYGNLALKSARLAATWRRVGIGSGDRVLLALPVGLDLYAAIAGLWRIGATIVFPEPAMGYAGLRHAVAMTKPKALLTSGWYRLLRIAAPELWHIPVSMHVTPERSGPDDVCDVPLDHPALISFTSGSTGKPKGIIRSHGFLAAQNSCVETFLKPSRDQETDLVAFPVFVIANLGLGVTSVLPTWKLCRHDKTDPGTIARTINNHKITRALIPPSICEVMTRGPQLPGLKNVFTGGGPVFPDLLERLSSRLPDSDICTVYGSTEAEPIATQRLSDLQPGDLTRMREGQGLLAGAPIKQIQLQLIEREIVVTGDHVNKSYLDGQGDAENKIHFDDMIWHRTGDAGALDEQGRLWLLGRHASRAGDFFPFMTEAIARIWPGARSAALLPKSEPPTLFIEGDVAHLDTWRRHARAIGELHVVQTDTIPMDARHHSKIDYARLKTLIGT